MIFDLTFYLLTFTFLQESLRFNSGGTYAPANIVTNSFHDNLTNQFCHKSLLKNILYLFIWIQWNSFKISSDNSKSKGTYSLNLGLLKQKWCLFEIILNERILRLLGGIFIKKYKATVFKDSIRRNFSAC